MKNTLLASASILLVTIVGANELSWVDEQIEAIKPPRKGVYISNVKNPFVFLEKNGYKKITSSEETTSSAVTKTSSNATEDALVVEKPKVYTKLTLELVINSSAMINGKWYKKDEKIRGYTLVDINKNFVTLKKGNKKLTLSTRTINKTLKL